ncbi:hypothetical protein MmTuc01_0288 [Methanosarcina mazei Tuc01]|uniref:Uncharacterized protein n=1 Tax=Methanosarcina mazei Tuc01 TaxID=1236903 RepID=M1P5R4_METMZ|nr:hypothetical protein [Methanosarcina mazei]AGF95737.1 hypothetical protein MmTuc01_0288 [Methanosarcina mazei Tuc01]
MVVVFRPGAGKNTISCYNNRVIRPALRKLKLRTGKLQGVTHDVIILHNIKLMRDFAESS